MKEITRKSAFYRFGAWLFTKVLYRVRYEGLENIPADGSVILCSNHLSNTDPIFLCARSPRIGRFMAKKELFSVPVLKNIILALGAFPVDRGHADLGAIRQGLRLLNENEMVGIFPQGTTHYKGNHPKDTPIKTGVGMLAARTGATILPACVQTKDFRLKLFRKVVVRFGKPIAAEEYQPGEHTPAEYERITALAFDRICGLLK